MLKAILLLPCFKCITPPSILLPPLPLVQWKTPKTVWVFWLTANIDAGIFTIEEDRHMSHDYDEVASDDEGTTHNVSA